MLSTLYIDHYTICVIYISICRKAGHQIYVRQLLISKLLHYNHHNDGLLGLFLFLAYVAHIVPYFKAVSCTKSVPIIGELN
jgi:phosphate starvation-inducible membrane PsiE